MTNNTTPWIGEAPEWLLALHRYAKARGKTPLDFGEAKVPKRIQKIIQRAEIATLEDMQQEIFEINDANGWFEKERSFGDDIALLHSEVSEMFEAYRDHGFADVTDHNTYGSHDATPVPPKPEGVGSEAADILIRLLDTCRRAGIDIRAEYERKSAYNATRGHRHGGKLL